MLLGLRLVLLYCAPTNEREGQLLGVLLLPAAYIRQERVEGPQPGSVEELGELLSLGQRCVEASRALQGPFLALSDPKAALWVLKSHEPLPSIN
jgi:hypothetical protein